MSKIKRKGLRKKAKKAFEATKEAKAKTEVVAETSERANRLDERFKRLANEAGVLDELMASPVG